MNKTKTLILGASGMLGSAVFRAFSADPKHLATATIRAESARRYFSPAQQDQIIAGIDVLDHDSLVQLFGRTQPDVVINCVGLIKQFASSKDPLVALPLNSMFPHRLARLAAIRNTRVIHVSTDCVFAGDRGMYTEDCKADANDLYGVSKHLGEIVDYDNAVTLRTSIIGRELASNNSLVDWFLAQGGSVKGYTKAIFSGLPTCELASVIKDVVIPDTGLRGLYHVSASPIAKFDLLRLISDQYSKKIEIIADETVTIDRSLKSVRFQQATGYAAADWPALIEKMYDTDLRKDHQNVR